MTKTKESNQFVKKEFPVQKLEIEAGAYSDTLGVEHPEPFADLIEAFGLHTWVYSCANLIDYATSRFNSMPDIDGFGLLRSLRNGCFSLISQAPSAFGRYGMNSIMEKALAIRFVYR